MPLPSPKGKEKRSAFVSRCVSFMASKGEGKDAAQRVAICNSRFKKSKGAIDFTIGELEALNILLGAEEKKKKKKKKKDDGVTY